MSKYRLRQRGFSLIEALIALLVLSIGLIGVAAMQLKALQSATAGYQRSVVTVAAVDAQERLWAELPGLAQNSEDCTDIDINNVEAAWVEWWDDNEASNPLRNVNWVDSGISPGDTDCEFTISVVLDDGPGEIETDLSYTFRLPKL
ncbi:type IV pilus modification protein PilV [Halomonas sp. MES3-P3E]|uniref:type IV pilus modification protein PilV n=1 Tax=Halomonas sp. MES3-P3E TaxID=2058321 RepID=UPI000C340DC4|nr:type IV pilus modification protein PilV [Halomonas sp. MES3-P3E]PKG50796.1 type IV pilus modification protein PilV [Halomonas sp. MES3-P3E]